MNYYEICKDDLKLVIRTDIMCFADMMDKYFSGCFSICEYNKNNISNETVVIDIIQNNNLKVVGKNCFVMGYNTYICCDNKNRILFIYDDKFNEIQCINLKRIVIDIFAKYYESMGTYFVHAAAVVNKENKKATVFIGDTGSGKTTNLLFYLQSGQYNYMGNDRIGLRYYNGDLIANGFPSNLGLRYPTLELNSKLKDMILPYIDNQKYSRYIKNLMNDEKITLTVFNLLNVFNCRLIDKSIISDFIITCHDEKAYGDVFEKISCKELLEQIEKQHIPSVSKEQYFLNDLLDFKYNKNMGNLSSINISAYKSNLHPNDNKRLIKRKL